VDFSKNYTTLKQTREFQRLFKKGKNLVTYAFVCYYAPNTHSPETNRLGIVASKKVGNAVKRNRAKRVIREAFRLTEPQLHTKSQRYDFVFVARGRTPELKSGQVCTLITNLFAKL
jgi:ribonuclease P protein component